MGDNPLDHMGETYNRAVLNALTAHIAVLDRGGTIVAVNAAWEQFARANGGSELTAATGVGANYLAVCRAVTEAGHPLAAEALSGIAAVLSGARASFTLEYPCHAPGEERWFVMCATPLDGHGGAVITHENVSALWRLQAELAQFFNLSLDMHCIAGFDGYLKCVNLTFERTFGYTAETLRAQPFLSFIHPDDRAATEHAFEQLAGGADAIAFENRCRCYDSSYRLVLWNATPMPSTRLVYASARDITEQSLAQEALSRKNMFLHLLQDVAITANQATSVEEALRVATEQICTHIGWPVGHAYLAREGAQRPLVSESWYLADPQRFDAFRAITDALDIALIDDLPRQVLVSGTCERVADLSALSDTARARAMGGLDIHAGFALPVLVGSEVAAVLEFFSPEARELDAALLDVMSHVGVQLGRVIDRVRAEAALREERARLAQRVAERTVELSAANAELTRAVQVKDEFLASMSHELRTPLNAVLGLTEGLREEAYGPLSPQQHQVLRTVAESGQHLLQLINDILDLAKLGAGKLNVEPTPIAVSSVCQSSLNEVRPAALKKQIDIGLALDPAVDYVHADRPRLRQILVNLLSNAVKFTPAGGRVGIEVLGHAAGNTVDFVVWDTGIGITPENIDYLFQPFVQIDSRLARQYEGTGLGLALVARLAEMHNGSVRAQSIVGAGSRFTVTLPWHAEGGNPEQL